MNNEWTLYKGFSEPEITMVGNKLNISWQPKSYDELEAFCWFHYGKPFSVLDMTYEDAIESVLKLQMKYTEKIIESMTDDDLMTASSKQPPEPTDLLTKDFEKSKENNRDE